MCSWPFVSYLPFTALHILPPTLQDWVHECHSQRQLCPMEPFLMHSGRPWVHSSTGGAQQPRAAAGAEADAAGGGEGRGRGWGGGGRGGGGRRGRAPWVQEEAPGSAQVRGRGTGGGSEWGEVRARGGSGEARWGHSGGGAEGEGEGAGAGEREGEGKREGGWGEWGAGGWRDREARAEGEAQPCLVAAPPSLEAEEAGAALADVQEAEARQDVLRNLAYLRQQAERVRRLGPCPPLSMLLFTVGLRKPGYAQALLVTSHLAVTPCTP